MSLNFINTIFPPQGDEHLSNVSFLALFEGAQDSQNITEENGIILQRFGNAKINKTNDKFGKGHLLTATSPASYIKYLATPRTGRGMVGDFTIEMWIRPNNMSTAQAVLSNYDAQGRGFEIAFNSGQLWIATGTGAGTLPFNGFINGRWGHFALTRKGSNTYIFIDGVLVLARDAGLNEAGMSSYTEMGIGARPNGAIPFNGGISNLRITAGVARYDKSFIVPTEPFSLK